jgi:ribosomal protein L37AE/L43A
MFAIPIIHCCETDFFDSFRADLIKCQEQAAILSPFLSYNRAVRYYPILQSLAARNVRIDIYAKPRNEQPESLQDTFDVVERGLKRQGTYFHVRPGMHEKIGIIDRKILWHGSLNIFSHNDTRESMLRFESSDLVEEVLKDLKIGVFSDLKPEDQWSSIHSDVAYEAPSCPKCGQKMVFFEKAGMWICADSPSCSGTLSRDLASEEVEGSSRPKQGQRVNLACPICQSPMEVSRGVFMRIVCSSQECGFSLDPRLSAGILRVLKRRLASDTAV